MCSANSGSEINASASLFSTRRSTCREAPSALVKADTSTLLSTITRDVSTT